MSDSIDRITGAGTPRAAERVAAPSALRPRLQREEDSGFSYEDRVDIAVSGAVAGDVLDISVAMVRALIAGTLPEEAVKALAGYAPLGDLDGKEELCDRLDQKAVESFPWPASASLAQALERAAI